MDTDTDDIATGLSTCITKDGQTVITANIPMAGFKLTGLALGSAANDSASVQNLLNAASFLVRDKNDFRLTLSSGNPVADILSSTTLYAAPYKGSSIGLFDGSSTWNIVSSAEFSIALGTLTSGLPYDVFCFSSGGTATLELLAWTNGTTRATALTTQDGVLVKSGATTRRYMGTFYTISTTQTADYEQKRYLWNYYNRVPRNMSASVSGSAYTYTTATIRQANASSQNQLNYFVGVSEDAVSATSNQVASNTNTGVLLLSGMAQDSTTTFSLAGNGVTTAIANGFVNMRASGSFLPSIGVHFLSLNEFSTATGTTTWAPATVGCALQLSGTILG